MRILHAIRQDIRYQVRYGFYLIYAIVVALYTAILLILPVSVRSLAAIALILSDPVLLGFIFIGGIWLLEKGERLISYYVISPLCAAEYVLSKAISLSILSTLASLPLILIGIRPITRGLFLLPLVFVGATIFALFGITLATFARSVNHYIVLMIPAQIIIVIPTVLYVIGADLPVIPMLPGPTLWLLAYETISLSPTALMAGLTLIIWLIIACGISFWRIPRALMYEKGES